MSLLNHPIAAALATAPVRPKTFSIALAELQHALAGASQRPVEVRPYMAASRYEPRLAPLYGLALAAEVATLADFAGWPYSPDVRATAMADHYAFLVEYQAIAREILRSVVRPYIATLTQPFWAAVEAPTRAAVEAEAGRLLRRLTTLTERFEAARQVTREQGQFVGWGRCWQERDASNA